MSSIQNSLIENAYNIVRYHADASVVLVALFPTVYVFRGGEVYSIFVGVSIASMVLALFIIALVKAMTEAAEIIRSNTYNARLSTLKKRVLVIAYSIVYTVSLTYVLRIVVPLYIYMVFYTLIAGEDSTSSLESGVTLLSLFTPMLFTILSAIPILFLALLRIIERNNRAIER